MTLGIYWAAWLYAQLPWYSLCTGASLRSRRILFWISAAAFATGFLIILVTAGIGSLAALPILAGAVIASSLLVFDIGKDQAAVAGRKYMAYPLASPGTLVALWSLGVSFALTVLLTLVGVVILVLFFARFFKSHNLAVCGP